MKILIFSWRDISNPSSGGAEVLTHEISSRWVRKGHTVVIYSSAFRNCKKEETIDGVKIVRGGTSSILSFSIPVHLKAFFWYMKNRKTAKYDVVIDEIHGLPFFTPLFVKERKVALICEVANEIWDTMFPFPFNLLGKTAEILYFSFYKKIPFLTISHSTEKELIKKGVSDNSIFVLPMGVTSPSKIKALKKETDPTVLYVGRISKTKGVEDAILALKLLKDTRIKLWIVGRGEENYIHDLRSLAKKIEVDDRVRFLGFVTEEEKFLLMSRAHLLVVPSMKEGWGLIVTEAGLVGTPSVVYDVPGLNEVVSNNESGIAVKPGPENLALGIEKLLKDSKFYTKLQKGALERARLYTWDDTANRALEVLRLN